MPKRRAHGEGMIRKRADGRWEARLSLGVGPDGRRRVWSAYARSQADARRLLDEARQKMSILADRPTAPPTLAAFAASWLDHIAAVRRPKTLENYRYLLECHVLPVLGAVRLDRLTVRQIQALVDARRAVLSANTIRRMHAVLRACLNQAIRWGMLSGPNPAERIDLPLPVGAEIQPLSPIEAQRLLQVVRMHRLAALYTVALACGLRPGEALGLRWQDVDLERGILRVSVQLQRVGRTAVLVPLKTDRAQRLIVLPDIARASLAAHRVQQEAERARAGASWQDWGLVFTTQQGRPLERRNVVRLFKALLRKAGLPDRRLYDLRHTCASLLIAQGVHPRLIQDLLGHSTYRLTMDTYGHVYAAGRQEAAERMDEVLGAAWWSDAGHLRGRTAEARDG